MDPSGYAYQRGSGIAVARWTMNDGWTYAGRRVIQSIHVTERTGRKPRAESVASSRVVVNLTPDQRTRVAAGAKRAGLSLRAWIVREAGL